MPNICIKSWSCNVEYDPMTLCWHLRRSYLTAHDFFMKEPLDFKVFLDTKGSHSLESDVAYFKESTDETFFPFSPSVSIHQMDNFYRFQSQLPDIVNLITRESYEQKLKNRREYSLKVSMSRNYV